MGVSLLLATLLCLTTWMTSVHATNGHAVCQCPSLTTTQIRFEKIVNYTIQTAGACPVAATVFLTKKNKYLCSDPNRRWTQIAMRKVDRETEALLLKAESEEGSASNSITTPRPVTTVGKKTPRRGKRNGQQWRSKQNRRGRKGQNKAV